MIALAGTKAALWHLVISPFMDLEKLQIIDQRQYSSSFKPKGILTIHDCCCMSALIRELAGKCGRIYRGTIC